MLRFYSLLAAVFMLGACAHTSSTSYKPKRELFLYHKVKPNDTLYEVGKKYNVPWREILRVNRISDPRSLKIGTRLKIPAVAYALNNRSQAGSNTLLIENTRQGGSESITPYLWPVRGRVSSLYGSRNGRLHKGIDIAAPKGRVITAFSDGIVEYAGWIKGYGRTVILRHRTVKTVYAHLSRFGVRRNQLVRQGQLLGYVGSSGNATGNHLHFEIRSKQNNRALNPLAFIYGRFAG